MPIRGMLDGGVFDPHQIAEMVAAFESTLAELDLVDRTDPVIQLVAKTIIDCAKQGEFDRVKLRDCAIEALTKH